ncbi:hypothetical protein [Nocardia carnea]|uniref:DUF3558 domain-containing protein n=1 Tax=Nocardia carnea TaxID=37328 RepID=A0ABW7TW95_9NOCA|nr:hypothetical protein [Nocardia carnea]
MGSLPKPQFARISTIAAVVMLCVTTLVGCTSTVQGYPLPAGFAGTYRDQLGHEDLDNVLWRDHVRMLDPCGFINDAAIATLGAPTYFGGAQAFSECQVVFRPSVTEKGIYKVVADLSSRSAEPANATVNGLPVNTQAGLGCLITVPYRERGFSYWVHSKDGPEGFGHELNACDEGLDFVAAALPTLDTTPLRRDTTHGFNTPLANIDPCAALDHLDIDYSRWQIFTGLVASTCEFRFDGEDESTQYGWTNTQKTLDMLFHAHVLDYPVRTIDGVRAVQSDTCSLDIYLGETDPRVVDIDADGPPTDDYWAFSDHWVDVVELTARDDCPRLDEVASAIIAAYRAAPPT